MLTLNQIAVRWNVAYSTVFSLVRRGKLPAYRFGTAWRVREEDLVEYEETCQYVVPRSKWEHQRIITKIVD